MKNNILHTIFLILFCSINLALASDFSVEEIHKHASRYRVQTEAKKYIDDLPPDAIKQIVDQLDFSKDGRGKNTFIFSFVCRKASKLQDGNISYDKDYVFSKLTNFVRSSIEKGDLGMGGVAMNSLSRFDHPEVIKLANELTKSQHEMTQSNAKLLLEKHEQRKSGIQTRQSQAKGVSPQESIKTKDIQQQTKENKPLENRTWWNWVFLPLILLVGVFLVVRANAGKES